MTRSGAGLEAVSRHRRVVHPPDQGLYGTALQGKRHEALWYEWLNFLYSFGGDMLEVKSGSECGPVIVNSPQAMPRPSTTRA